MPRMTKAQHAKHDRLRANLDRASDLVFAAGPDRNTRFSECLKLASETTRNGYEKARADLVAFERQMIDECRAYRGALNMFTPYVR